MAEKIQRTGTDETLQALNALVENLVGEDLRNLRSSIEKLSSTLPQQIEAVKKETTAAIIELRKELNGHLAELTRSIEETRKAAENLKRQKS